MSVLVYLLSGGTWLKPKTHLVTFISDATGVEHGADVQLNGVLIGTVESVRMTPSRTPSRVVEVRLKIEEDFRRYIPDDSVTGIDSANLLGDKFIDITMGHSSRPVPPDGELAYRAPSNLMQNIDLEQFAGQLRVIDQTIQDIQAGKGPLGEFAVKDALYNQFVDGVIRVEKKMHAAMATQSQLGQALYTATMHDDLVQSLRQLDDRLMQLQSNPLLRDSAQYDQIRDQLGKIRNTLADLNAGKGTGGALLTSDATYLDWTRRLAQWIRNVDELNSGEGSMGQMLSSAQMYESLNGALRELQTTMKELRQNPQRFLRVKF